MTTNIDLRQCVELNQLRHENEYLRKLVDETTSNMLALNAQTIEIRQELEQKRRGFSLMAELAVALDQEDDYHSLFVSVARKINSTLNMQRTAVLIPGENGYQPIVLQGYPAEEKAQIKTRVIQVDDELLAPYNHVLVTAADLPDRLEKFREALCLPYFIAAPIMLHKEVAALLVTGRTFEQKPYMPRLGESDVETVRTVGAYLAAILTAHRLQQAENLAKHDSLTELPNLRGTSENFNHTLAVAQRGGFHVGALFIDLDEFKSVNDTFGHATGDLVLKTVAERLLHCVRGSDFVGRIGGDEFLVILSHVQHPEDAGLVAKNIIKKISQPIKAGKDECRIGASIGIAIFPEHGNDAATLINAADEAMYEVKSIGKNTFAFAKRGTETGNQRAMPYIGAPRAPSNRTAR